MNTSLFTDSPYQTSNEALSLEAFEEYLTEHADYQQLVSAANENLVEDLKALIPTALRTWFGFAKELPDSDITMLKWDQYKFSKKIGAADYMDFKHLVLNIPAGLKVDYFTFLNDFLKPAVEFLEKKAAKDIKEFTRYSGDLLNRPQDKLKSLNLIPTTNGQELDKIKATLKNYVEANSSIASMPYQSAFKRNKDWLATLPLLQQLTLRMNKLQPKELNKQSQKAQINLSKFNNWLEKTPEGMNVSPEAISTIGQYTLMVGKELEFFALIHYYLKAINQAMDNNIRKVEDHLA